MAHPHDKQYPIAQLDFRTDMLIKAGFGTEDQARVLRKVLKSAEDGLDATKETPSFVDGKLGDVHDQPDHSARAKAREQIIDLIGVKAPTKSVNERIQVPAIELAPWMKTITVTSKDDTTPLDSDIPSRTLPVVESGHVTPLPTIDTNQTTLPLVEHE